MKSVQQKKKTLVAAWNRYRKKRDVTNMIPAAFFNEVYVLGYRQGCRDTKHRN
jgi:hypothetical protein